jgi:spore coat polysaccharide biosynthesis protein SpsF
MQQRKYSVLVIIQARMSSTRLPGKVLMPILQQPMLLRQIERISRAKQFDHLIVATSTEDSDDAIVELCERQKIAYFRGDLHDVLDRFYQASEKYPAQHIVRITADCPLIDPQVVDQVVSMHLQQRHAYTSNVFPPSYPDGLDVEVMSQACLAQVWQQASTSEQREHVTRYIHENPKDFSMGNLSYATDLSTLRWTVDTLQDYHYVKSIYEKLYPANAQFSMQDILTMQGE